MATTTTAEQMLTILRTTSMFQLGNKMPQIIDGITDLVARVQRLEAAEQARNTPSLPQPGDA